MILFLTTDYGYLHLFASIFASIFADILFCANGLSTILAEVFNTKSLHILKNVMTPISLFHQSHKALRT
jgi:hypothetical protein